MEDVKIIDMDEMLVASFHALGESPEEEAIRKMQTWARPRGLINDQEKYPVFGFDNPFPEPGKKEYGYEVWVKLDEEVQDDEVTFKRIPATKYAMLYSPGFQNIGPNWRKLMNWVKNSEEYEHAAGQCIEGHVLGSTEDGDFALYLYEPVKEK
jgi:DNA gyrase inhibitor GyrI